jgi:acyl carrier protein
VRGPRAIVVCSNAHDIDDLGTQQQRVDREAGTAQLRKEHRNMDPTFLKIRELLTREFELLPDAVAPETDLATLGVDSLAALEFLFALEDAFEVRFGQEGELRAGTVQDVVDLVNQALARGHDLPAAA